MGLLVSTQCHTHSQPACFDAAIPGQELILKSAVNPCVMGSFGP